MTRFLLLDTRLFITRYAFYNSILAFYNSKLDFYNSKLSFFFNSILYKMNSSVFTVSQFHTDCRLLATCTLLALHKWYVCYRFSMFLFLSHLMLLFWIHYVNSFVLTKLCCLAILLLNINLSILWIFFFHYFHMKSFNIVLNRYIRHTYTIFNWKKKKKKKKKRVFCCFFLLLGVTFARIYGIG